MKLMEKEFERSQRKLRYVVHNEQHRFAFHRRRFIKFKNIRAPARLRSTD